MEFPGLFVRLPPPPSARNLPPLAPPALLLLLLLPRHLPSSHSASLPLLGRRRADGLLRAGSRGCLGGGPEAALEVALLQQHSHQLVNVKVRSCFLASLRGCPPAAVIVAGQRQKERGGRAAQKVRRVALCVCGGGPSSRRASERRRAAGGGGRAQAGRRGGCRGGRPHAGRRSPCAPCRGEACVCVDRGGAAPAARAPPRCETSHAE